MSSILKSSKLKSAGEADNGSNSASVEFEVEVKVEAELGKNRTKRDIRPLYGHFTCHSGGLMHSGG